VGPAIQKPYRRCDGGIGAFRARSPSAKLRLPPDVPSIVAAAIDKFDAGDAAGAEALFLRGIRRAIEDGNSEALARLEERRYWFWASTTRLEQARIHLLTVCSGRRVQAAGHWPAFASLAWTLPFAESRRLIYRVRPEREWSGYLIASLAESLGCAGRLRLAVLLLRRLCRWAQHTGDADIRWRAEARWGRIYERRGDRHAAIAIWQRSVRNGSRDAITLERLSICLMRERRFQDCVDVFSPLVNESNAGGSFWDSLRARVRRATSKVFCTSVG
jgi:hypothetical protein